MDMSISTDTSVYYNDSKKLASSFVCRNKETIQLVFVLDNGQTFGSEYVYKNEEEAIKALEEIKEDLDKYLINKSYKDKIIEAFKKIKESVIEFINKKRNR